MKTIKEFAERPALYEKTQVKFWNDPHISAGMLKAHLNPELESATRKLDFVKQSVCWITGELPASKYKRLLDLGCGPGIYAELFCAAGYDVTGLDISENSVRYAENSAKEKGLEIKYSTGDYTDAHIAGIYDLVTMIYCDLGVLSGRERKQVLKTVYNSLSEDGCFLFDVFTPMQYEESKEFKVWSFENGGFWRSGPYFLLQSRHHYENDKTFLNRYIVITENETACYNNWEHTFSIEELKKDLSEAGFKNLQFYGNVAGEEYSRTGKTVCVIAKKR